MNHPEVRAVPCWLVKGTFSKKTQAGGLTLSCQNRGEESFSVNYETRASIFILKSVMDLLQQFNPRIENQHQSWDMENRNRSFCPWTSEAFCFRTGKLQPPGSINVSLKRQWAVIGIEGEEFGTIIMSLAAFLLPGQNRFCQGKFCWA